VAPELADDVKCSSLPAGISKDDAYVILSRVRDTGDIAATGQLLQREDLTLDDIKCMPHDLAAGMNVDEPRYENDAPAIMQKWGR
jgi:hypothetical protein